MEKYRDQSSSEGSSNKAEQEKSSTINNNSHSSSSKKPYTMAMMTRDLLHKSIADGSLKEKLEKISSSAEVFQSVLSNFSQIAGKAQEQLENQSEQVSSDDNLSILTEMWGPMLLNLISTSEFQNLMASMLVRMVN